MARGVKRERKPEVRHGALRRSNGWLNALRIGGAAALVVVLSGVATVSYAVWGLASNIDTVKIPAAADVDVAAGDVEMDGAFSILLVGSDTREGQKYTDGVEGELNDVTMLLHVSEDHKNATIMSFPRDLMLPIPSCPGPDGEPDYTSPMAEAQLNSTLSIGGLPCTAATISELTGLDVPYAALVTFDGVIAVSNALGGVEVCLTEPVVDPNTELDLPAGNVSLKGMEALQFLRTRYGVGDGGDQSRISNQQMYMSALVRQLQSSDTLTDPIKVYTLAKAGLENMTLSSNMASVKFMQGMASTLRNMDLANINFVQYPTVQHPADPNRVAPDYTNATTLIDLIDEGKSFTVTDTGTGVAISEEQAKKDKEAEKAEKAKKKKEKAESGTDEETTEESDDAPVKLPEGITGQSAETATCSQGRTVF